VNVGKYKILRSVPDDTRFLLGWSAIWSFGHRAMINNKYVEPGPVVLDNEFYIVRDPLAFLVQPGSEMPLVIELKLYEPARARTAARNFVGDREKIIALPNGTAYAIPLDKFNGAMLNVRLGKDSNCVVLDMPSFDVRQLVGNDTFNDLLSKLRTTIRKLR